MRIESFIPYHVPFEETLVSAISSIVFKELQLANYPRTILSEIIEEPQYGYTASASKEPVGIKYVRITDIQAGKIEWDSVPYCRCDNPEKYLLKENDILFARTGGTTGKSFIVKGKIPESIFASYLIRIRPEKGTDPDFLYWFFQTKQYWSQIRTEKMGSAQPNVNGKKLSSLEILVPEIRVQEAIAEYLRAYRNKIYDQTVELPALPAILKKAEKKTRKIENLLVRIEESGRLRAEAMEDAEELVNSALQHLELSKFEVVSKRIGECSGMKTGKTPPTSIFNYYDADIDWYCPSDLTFTKKGYPAESDRKISYLAVKDKKATIYEKDTTLLVAIGGSIGKVAITKERCSSNQQITGIKFNGEIEPRYGYYWVRKLFLKIVREASQATLPIINQQKIGNLEIKYPKDMQIQRRIVAYLDSLQEKVDELKKLQDETEKEIEELIPSILDKAFEGEL